MQSMFTAIRPITKRNQNTWLGKADVCVCVRKDGIIGAVPAPEI